MTSGERGGIPAPFTGHAATVLPGWIDDNGHMNLAYYVLVFDGATDRLWDAIGLGEPYRRATGLSTFAAEMHTLYRAELRLGDPMRVSSQILGADGKRIHLAHELFHAGTDTVSAQQELMLLHVDLGTRKVVPFPPDAMDRVNNAARDHAALPRPDWTGRRVAMPERAQNAG